MNLNFFETINTKLMDPKLTVLLPGIRNSKDIEVAKQNFSSKGERITEHMIKQVGC